VKKVSTELTRLKTLKYAPHTVNEHLTSMAAGFSLKSLFSTPQSRLKDSSVQIRHIFSDPALAKSLLKRLEQAITRPFTFMEVCGTHTVALFRTGLASLLPPGLTHLSGPGCPVCVTHDSEIAGAVSLAGRADILLATFGDLMRVPDPKGRSLKIAKAEGAHVEIVYSPLEALALARAHPGKQVVFLGVGFETTAPAVAATILAAREQNLKNFMVLSCHKLVPPALRLLLSDPNCAVDGFLLPGHVSTILGLEPYLFIAEEFKRPAVISGFEATDLLQALIALLEHANTPYPRVLNEYTRGVSPSGNPKAREIMNTVFATVPARWRGLGLIPNSGLSIRPELAEFDAMRRLELVMPEGDAISGCCCGEILRGRMQPPSCPLFGKACTPSQPVGPCMVSTEGSCAAYYNYRV
jgi:hydrogenase expression/formation protein HypD